MRIGVWAAVSVVVLGGLFGCSSGEDLEPPPQSAAVVTPFGEPPAEASVAPGNVVLTVESPGAPPVTFTPEQLKALPQATATIRTPQEWLDKAQGLPARQEFRGAPLADVLEGAGVSDSARIRMVGADGYTVKGSVDDLTSAEAVVAVEADGAPITPEFGGPIRIVFPGGSVEDDNVKYWVLWLQDITQL